MGLLSTSRLLRTISSRVSEVWDSREQFDAFVERLMPVLKDVGVELSGEPEMLEIHNIIQR
jgi:hypothetical protein